MYGSNEKELYDLLSNVVDERVELWLEYILFTPLWWFGITLSIVPWLFWIWFHNKNSRHRMLYVGVTVCLISVLLDFIGTQFELWMYFYEPFPFLPAYEPWDLTLIPVVIMTLIEYKPEASPYLKGIIFASLSAFVGEPFFKYVGVYQELNWSMFYSFPIYFIIYLFSHWLSRRYYFEKLY